MAIFDCDQIAITRRDLNVTVAFQSHGREERFTVNVYGPDDAEPPRLVLNEEPVALKEEEAADDHRDE
jgi:hypothetical protein